MASLGLKELRVQDTIPGETGYTIRFVKITSPGKCQGLCHCGHTHARDYAPPEIALHFAEKLVKGYGKDADISWILDHAENHTLHVLPSPRKSSQQPTSYVGVCTAAKQAPRLTARGSERLKKV